MDWSGDGRHGTGGTFIPVERVSVGETTVSAVGKRPIGEKGKHPHGRPDQVAGNRPEGSGPIVVWRIG
jgi:hypothetical protein